MGEMGITVIWVLGFCFSVFSDGFEVNAHGSTTNLHQSGPDPLLTDQSGRPSYHFLPTKNWMNDPNGPMYYKGVYHFFYQYNPSGAVFSDSMFWAHSVSYDLINWIHLNHALSPSEPYDINSCWSGSITILPANNEPVILYTGIDDQHHQVQNLATPKNLSDPYLREWVKFSRNPIINLPDGVDPSSFRDPTTAWQAQDGKWRVVIGSESMNAGRALLYQSEDFLEWTECEHPLYSLGDTGMWECPDFYPVSLNGTNGVETSVVNPSVKHVIKTGFNSHDYYAIGNYDPREEKFSPDDDDNDGGSLKLRYDYGKFYASKSFFDDVKKRRILWAWVNESDSMEDDIRKGWSGVQTIPRSVWLDKNGKQLIQWPVEEIELLREKKISLEGKKLEGGSLLEVVGINASQADVEIQFELTNLEGAEIMNQSLVDPQLLCSENDASINGGFGPFGLLVLASADLTEQTAIFFRILRAMDRFVVLMCSDHSRSSLEIGIDKTTYGAFVDLDPRHEKISLRSLIDHSIVESFGGNGRTCITSRVYPKLAIDKDAHLFVFNNGTQSVVISTLKAWSMKKALMISEGENPRFNLKVY